MTAFWEHTEDLHLPACDVSSTGELVSYEELYARADFFAEQLAHHAGRRFFLIIKAGNNLHSLIAYIACLRHKHACLLVSDSLDDEACASLCGYYEPDFIYQAAANEEGYELVKVYSDEHKPMHEDLRLLLSTSGSTGSPKLVRLSEKNILANAQSIAAYLKLDSSERPLTNLPMYYSYGLSVINSHLQVKACLLLTAGSLISGDFWGFATDHGATSLAGVPYTYDMLEMVNFRSFDIPSLRYMTQAGGKLSSHMVEIYANWADERGIRFYVMYGQTEATARMSYLPPEETLRRSSSIGIAIPGGQFYLRDSSGELTQERGRVGELIYQGDNVSMGYAYKREDFSLGDERGGVLSTGDVARCDEDGYYYITGRLNRFLKIAGNRFGLDEIEAYLRKRGISAYCGGVDDRLIVVIEKEDDMMLVAKVLKSKWKLSRKQYQVEILDCIPRSESGKVLYAQLFEPYLKASK